MPQKKERGLTPKQAAFVREYLVDLNAAQAAIRAGYAVGSARQTGRLLLTNHYVQSALSAGISARAARTEVSQDRVVRELALVAFSDPRKVMAWGPDGVTLRDSEDLTDAEAAIISEVAETAGAEGSRNMRLKMADKMKALELLGRHLGMFKDKLEHSGNVFGLTINAGGPPPKPDGE